MVEKLKVRFFRKTIDYDEFVDLQIALVRAGIRNVEASTDHILLAANYELAEEYGLKYIIGGGNHHGEGIMPESWMEDAKDLTFLKAVFKKQMGRDLKNIPVLSLWKWLYYRFVKKIEIINLLDYYPEFRRDKSIEFLQKEYGYVPYGDKHCESKFTAWFQKWYLPAKFNIDKRRAHYSSLINAGEMTRAEAIEKLKEPLYYSRLGKFEDEQRILGYPKTEKIYGDYPNEQKLRKFLAKAYGNIRKRK